MPRRRKHRFDSRPSTPPWTFAPTSPPVSNATSSNTSLAGTMNNAHSNYVFPGVESTDGEYNGNFADFNDTSEIIQPNNRNEFYNDVNLSDYHDFSYHEFDSIVPPSHLLLNSYEVSIKNA